MKSQTGSGGGERRAGRSAGLGSPPALEASQRHSAEGIARAARAEARALLGRPPQEAVHLLGFGPGRERGRTSNRTASTASTAHGLQGGS